MKSEVRKRLEASILPTCPECGSKNTREDVHVFRCGDCGVAFYTERLVNE